MVTEKLSERKAYAKATSEFYLIRAQQEEEEREARQKMTELLQNATASRKYTQKALYHEEQALKKGQGLAI
jgi:small subunit ribosomal protein S23